VAIALEIHAVCQPCVAGRACAFPAWCRSCPTSPQPFVSGHGYRMELSTLSCFNPSGKPIHAPIYRLITQPLWDLV